MLAQGTAQVDRDVLEKLEAPLTHLLRNAADHGIETPEQRLLAGKPAEGVIRLRISHQAGLLVLDLIDDGAGVDLDRLRRAIVARQLSTAETVAQLSEEELLSFLFLPGFSLRDTVTDGCLGWEATERLLRDAARQLQQQRRSAKAAH